MKTLSSFCALALAAGLISGVFASQASAKGMHFAHPMDTTVLRLADKAAVVVVGRLTGVENITLDEPGRDGAFYKRVGDGSQQDGDPNVLRMGVLRVNETLKGASHVQDGEIRFVSIRQLQYGAYSSTLKDGNALYFLAQRQDGRLAVLSDERGIVSAPAAGGVLLPTVDFVRAYVDASALSMGARFSAMRTQIMAAIQLNGSRLSVDCATELSWNFEDYAAILTVQDKQTLVQLALTSPVGSPERPELITTLGRYKPDGATDALFTLLYSDISFSTTSLCAWALEMNDRIGSLSRMLEEYHTLSDDAKLATIRALGLIRPKDYHDGADIRNSALALVGGLLVHTTPEPLLREALIASRDMRSGSAHVESLKNLIDNRATNGVSEHVLKGAIVALGAARIVNFDVEGNNHDQLYAEEYLLNLQKTAPELKQIVTSALKTPWTTLVTGADGLAR